MADSKNNTIKGINYYHESMGHLPKTIIEIRQDISLINEKFNAIKIYHNPFLYDTLNHVSLISTEAKKSGLYVVWNENNDNIQFTENNWNDYSQRVLNDCSIANKLSVDEFIVGNEISIHNDNTSGYNDTNLPIKIKNLIKSCKQLTGAVVSYQDGWWKKDAWNNSRLEDIDKIYFTLYENIQNFEGHALDIRQKFGTRAIIGEWSTQSTMSGIASDEIDWASQLVKRNKILNNMGMQSYYFCFRDTGENHNNKGFGLWKYDRLEPHLAWLLF